MQINGRCPLLVASSIAPKVFEVEENECVALQGRVDERGAAIKCGELNVSNTMRVAIGLPSDLGDEHLHLARQFGCDDVIIASPRIPGDKRWEYEDLARLRERVEGFGLRIEAIQNTPIGFINPIRLGLPDRDECIEHYQATIRNLGRAGIPMLAYNWRPDQLYRTGTRHGRGGAEVTVFDRALTVERPLTYGREYSAEEMWANYAHFVKAVMPVAEEAGVRLAVHPDDPPGAAIGGVARIFSSFEGFKRGAEIADSPAWAILFCMGCYSEIGGNDYVQTALRHFGERGQLGYVHFRDVQGIGDAFAECFIGEGQVDITAALRTLKDVGYTGCLIDDHVPHLAGDTGWAARGRAYSTGYIMGLLRAFNDLT